MTLERFVFVQWLEASEKLNTLSGMEYEYWLGKTVGFVEIMANVLNCTFVEASRYLMDRKTAESA